MKQLPKRSGKWLFEILLRRYETKPLPARHQFTRQSMTIEQPLAKLTVEGPALFGALKTVTRMTGLGRKRVEMSFQSGKLVIAFEELRVSIPAVGSWPGVAKFPKAFLVKIAKLPLDQIPTVSISIENGRIIISRHSGECVWAN